MKSREFSQFTLLSWESLNQYGIKAGSVTGINTALHAPSGVNREEILKNRKAFSEELGVDSSLWTCADQVHGCKSAVITQKERGRGAFSSSSALKQTDALILSEKGLGALIFTADCLPLVLVDFHRRIGAVIHAGWRGIAGGIIPSVLLRMCSELNCRIENILAAAGPAVDSCCYQIDRPVFEAITKAFPETEDAFTPDGLEHWRLSLEKAVFLQLTSRGISPDRIEGSGHCTACNKNLSSWRREGASSGRIGTFLVL